jgi:hypothetical protein
MNPHTTSGRVSGVGCRVSGVGCRLSASGIRHPASGIRRSAAGFYTEGTGDVSALPHTQSPLHVQGQQIDSAQASKKHDSAAFCRHQVR